jgi:hypothetical protein
MYKKLIIFSITSILLTGNGCSFSADNVKFNALEIESPSDAVTYENNEAHMKITYPKQWDRIEGGEALVAFIAPPQDASDKFKENLIIDYLKFPQEGPPIDIKQEAENTARSIEKAYTNKQFKLLTSQATTVGKLPGWENMYSYKNDSDLSLKVRQFFVVQNHTGYLFTFSAEEKELPVYTTILESILQSFETTQ